jgi:hopanoid biosynthesis associated protein HpnK
VAAFEVTVRLIINADDFGRSSAINCAVERAHREGVLNSASLMVAGKASDEAVRIARRNPKLSVGLHLVAVDGPAVLGAALPNRPVRLGLKYQFSRAARRSLTVEVEAQFQRFSETGLLMSHVDGHQHMHLHPVVFELVLPLAEKFGARRIRIPSDDLRLALRHDLRRTVSKAFAAAVFKALVRRCVTRMRGTLLWSCGRTYGFFQSGNMSEPYVLDALGQVGECAEIYFHPTEGDRLDPLGPNPTDLATLLSPRVAALVRRIESVQRGDEGETRPTTVDVCDAA